MDLSVNPILRVKIEIHRNTILLVYRVKFAQCWNETYLLLNYNFDHIVTWKLFTQWYHTQQFVSRRLEPPVKAEGHLGPHRPTQSHRHKGHTHCHPPQAPTTLSLLIVNRECLFEARRGSILAGTHQPWQLFNQSARVSPTFCYNSNSSNRHPSRSKGHDVYCCYCCQRYYFLAQLAMYQAADWFSQPGSSSFRLFLFLVNLWSHIICVI